MSIIEYKEIDKKVVGYEVVPCSGLEAATHRPQHPLRLAELKFEDLVVRLTEIYPTMDVEADSEMIGYLDRAILAKTVSVEQSATKIPNGRYQPSFPERVTSIISDFLLIDACICAKRLMRETYHTERRIVAH